MSVIRVAQPRFALLISGILFVFLYTYPTSPILAQLFILNGMKVTFLLLCLVFVGINLQVKSQKFKGAFAACYRWWNIFLFAFLLIKIFLHSALLPIREILMLFISYSMFAQEINYSEKLLKSSCKSIFIMIWISLFSGLIFWLLSSSDLTEWSVGSLNLLNSENPIYHRPDLFYIVYYLTVIPHYYGDVIFLDIAYPRINFIFSEWTYLWYFIAPTLLLFAPGGAYCKKSCYYLCILFTVVLILSLSVWGLMSLLLTILIRIAIKKKLIGLILAILVIFGIIYFDIDNILDSLGGNKKSQFDFFLQNLDFEEIASLFGIDANFDDVPPLWGSTYIFWQYGAIGFALYLLLFTFSIYTSFITLVNNKFDEKTKRLALAVLVISFIGLKVTYLIPLYHLFLLGLLIKNVSVTNVKSL